MKNMKNKLTYIFNMWQIVISFGGLGWIIFCPYHILWQSAKIILSAMVVTQIIVLIVNLFKAKEL